MRRDNRRMRGKPCYYCGAPSDSKEHAPPQQMFKGFECDSITVPSCQKHNSAKGGNDQAIVSFLLIPLANGLERYPQEQPIKAAIELARPSFERAKRKALNIPLLKDAPEGVADLPNVSYLQPSVNVKEWLKQLTAALVYNALQRWDSTLKWDEAAVWSPHCIGSADSSSLFLKDVLSVIKEKRALKKRLKELSWIPGWSACPRPYPAVIYRFSLHFRLGEVVFHHVFYNQLSWHVWLDEVEESTLTTIEGKI